ncbi:MULTISPECIES: hypothetical protein [unclassified Corynebacterium]|uniref:hypothetical protein n=1 Tax=unclassified Corynebacterium TaxID=2624378 RepID=UPI0016426BCF|nr:MULTISPECIES: hypothetical protein [unclassified Corynebacterium]
MVGYFHVRQWGASSLVFLMALAAAWKYDTALPHPLGDFIQPENHLANFLPCAVVVVLFLLLLSRWDYLYERSITARDVRGAKALLIALVTAEVGLLVLVLVARYCVPSLILVVCLHSALAVGILLILWGFSRRLAAWLALIVALFLGSTGWFPSLFFLFGNSTGLGISPVLAAVEILIACLGVIHFINPIFPAPCAAE